MIETMRAATMAAMLAGGVFGCATMSEHPGRIGGEQGVKFGAESSQRAIDATEATTGPGKGMPE